MSSNTQTILHGEAGIAEAAQILRSGCLVALPTETVYGLAARADSAAAVARIYRAKGRPEFNPLIVHVASIAMARKLAEFDPRAQSLAERFWPGPLTLVLPARTGSGIAPAVTAGLPTIALRQPAHPMAAKVLDTLGLPLAAPSANRSYGISPTQPDHVLASLGNDAPPVLDGGRCEAGLESTIVALRQNGGWQLLRPGPVSAEELTVLLGPEDDARGAALVEAPGQLERHYSPGKPLHLGVAECAEGNFMIGFGDIAGDTNLSAKGDLAEAAARLYECLHLAARSPHDEISVAPVPEYGMGRAINDRLRRAAAG
ncbi:L-threonylcarbamoyladenylate synthase [Aurantiacibacter marinus]|uniref:Threonylcarbamoyl-AMP synthase n=1 Tax=Aurantiacibacter marinus TaxID=874156 RepID=A0A0H0XQW2_9SPHN|nr:L-threonylcarbamoyladenylate synthase [Aurantiacibacter marinus]KLI64754.1 translation factor Sua5 [Aurantiacibacter marinus]